MKRLLKPLVYMMTLGDTKNLRMDQVLYSVYKNDEHMEEHDPKLNNTYISPPEGHQVTELTKYDKVNHDSFASGEEDEYYSYDDKSCGNSSDTQSELEDDDFVPKTQ